MLELIEKPVEIKRAQRTLEASLRAQLSSQGRRLVTFRPSFVELEAFSFGRDRMYFAVQYLKDQSKYWNAFGLFDPDSKRQNIAVEINIRFDREEPNVAGFFARDPVSNQIFLMHGGNVGGGRTGIGRAAFMAWAKPILVKAVGRSGDSRTGLVVAELGSRRMALRIEAFVESVAEFKRAASKGELDSDEFSEKTREWRVYYAEFSGRKTRKAVGEREYITYHGEVVDALRVWREDQSGPRFHVTNSPLIDLLVADGEHLVEVYEVKTNTERQMLYTGLGQLLVHSGGDDDVALFLVLPKGRTLPDDIDAAILAAKVTVIDFEIGADDKVLIRRR